MKDLLNTVRMTVREEYRRAAEKFGESNNSPHESYAVILEEYEEAQGAGGVFADQMDSYWRAVKNGQSEEERNLFLDIMRCYAEHAAAEWIQAAAMCHKAMK